MSAEIDRIAEAIRARQRFVISSHERPDGDSIGSSLAMAFALRAMGKRAHVVHRDPPPTPLLQFPGVADITIASSIPDDLSDADAVIVIDCEPARTGIAGLDRYFQINIDHHRDNAGTSQLRWIDPLAAASGEMVYDVIRALGAPFTVEAATHVYVAIHMDTGSFHYGNITPKTFAICQAALEAGVDPVSVARGLYDSNNMGRLKLFGGVLSAMQLDPSGRVAIVYLDHDMARAAGGTYEDTEGLINLPLTVKEILAVVFFKQIEGESYRVSMRSKGEIDVGAIAKEFEGGGHRNAAGCTVDGAIDALQKLFVEKIEAAINGRSAGPR
ncbi:MAG TPA: bifunctional oligoribonuclease/PAP phosphatase NrnA [Vicinamibacterales bacterium]